VAVLKPTTKLIHLGIQPQYITVTAPTDAQPK